MTEPHGDPSEGQTPQTAAVVERPARRRRLVLLSVVVALPLLVLAWREVGLWTIPDGGDPFDLADVKAPDLADEDNAIVLYWLASDHSRPLAMPGPAPIGMGPGAARPPAPNRPRGAPNIDQWLQDNQKALAMWLAATECADALEPPLADTGPEPEQETLQLLRDFARTARLEAERLQREGDMPGASRMLLGLMRSSRHAALERTLGARLVAVGMHASAAVALDTWAKDSRTQAPELRAALIAAVRFQKDRLPTSFTFKHEYQRTMKLLADPARVVEAIEERAARGDDEGEFRPFGPQVSLWLKHEPERARRLYRLWMANWLAACDLPPGQRPSLIKSGPFPLFQEGPERPQPALSSSALLRVVFPPAARLLTEIDRETRRHETLILTLAEELYQREHGTAPARLGDLLGPDLQALPGGLSPDDPPSSATSNRPARLGPPIDEPEEKP